MTPGGVVHLLVAWKENGVDVLTVPFLQESEFQNLIFSSEWIYLPSPC